MLTFMLCGYRASTYTYVYIYAYLGNIIRLTLNFTKWKLAFAETACLINILKLCGWLHYIREPEFPVESHIPCWVIQNPHADRDRLRVGTAPQAAIVFLSSWKDYFTWIFWHDLRVSDFLLNRIFFHIYFNHCCCHWIEG